MGTIAVVVDHGGNRDLLADRLGGRHTLLVPESAAIPGEPFDLCIVDGPALGRLREGARARRQAEQPVFLPFLLVSPRRDSGMAAGGLWEVVDDHIATPVMEMELQARVEVLLRARDLSVQLDSALSKLKRTDTELRASADELARSNAELQQFAYVASHDLQEPLRMMASYAQLLERRYKGKLDADADDFIGFMVDGALRMQTLIDDLLGYSRVQSRGNPPEAVPVERALDRAIANLQAAIEESGAQVSHDPLPAVTADEPQLVQLLQNLLANAMKFRRDEPPVVHVSAQERGSEWIISVRDNGIGIAPEHRDRIFQVFERLHSREEYPGTGIGLAICRRIVERHGGRIWVESELAGGSIFFFTMPAARSNDL